MDKLQRQSATLKRINKPSDDPIGNLKLMKIRDDVLNNDQFGKNAALARNFLNYTDQALSETVELVNRAKELSVQMASSAANGADSRAMVAEEIRSLKDQLVAISNKRLGERYLFGGYKTLNQPFDEVGRYSGDSGQMAVEVGKDIFVTMNLTGNEVFLGRRTDVASLAEMQIENPEGQITEQGFIGDGDIYRTLDALYTALTTNNVQQIQGLLEPLDEISERIISLRAQVSSRVGGINASEAGMLTRSVYDAELQSRTEDADLIQVVSDIAKEETVLKASLSASQKLIQPNLLDFLR
jgi:flagellar hook-associated protein 3 FlgL